VTNNRGFSSAVARTARRTVPIVGLAGHLDRGLQQVSTGAVIGGFRSFSKRIPDRDPPALSQVIGRTVTSVSVIGGASGTSSRAQLAVALLQKSLTS
jgi:hypothetical protein